MSLQSDLPETQAERTRLAWRRTLIGVLAVAGIGALHLITVGEAVPAVVSSFLALCVALPIWHRQRTLRTSHPAATWEPLAVSVGICLLAVGLIITW